MKAAGVFIGLLPALVPKTGSALGGSERFTEATSQFCRNVGKVTANRAALPRDRAHPCLCRRVNSVRPELEEKQVWS